MEVRDACWRFDLRCVLHSCKKGKISFEGRDFKDLAAIQLEFLTECASLGLSDADVASFLPESWPRPKETVQPTPSQKRDASDPKVVASNAGGFQEGVLVFEKEVGPRTLYELAHVGTEVTVRKLDVLQLGQQSGEATLPLATLVETWSVFKGPRPMALPCNWQAFSWATMCKVGCRIFSLCVFIWCSLFKTSHPRSPKI